MSLFASLGQGDIWSISGIEFNSPINDILDKEQFSLEELLKEDELFIELKSHNTRLVNFLMQKSTVIEMIDMMIRPPVDAAAADDARLYRYPYICCEIFCFEIPELLAVVVDENEGELVLRLLSLLDTDGIIDNYLAGYFEKMMELLLRTCTSKVVTVLNRLGVVLFEKFVRHIDNYSVMQIVQRLLLPHIPFTAAENDDSYGLSCNWAELDSICTTLCSQLSGKAPFSCENSTLHTSDLLITVLQLSPAESRFVSNLCSNSCLDFLLNCAIPLEETEDSEVNTKETRIAGLSVLESLISRLCDIIQSGEPLGSRDHNDVSGGGIPEAVERLADSASNVALKLRAYLGRIIVKVRVLSESVVESFVARSAFPTSLKLGLEGLQTVRLVEAVVRLADPEIDLELTKSDILQNCIALFFACESHSLLHMSVQRMLCMIIEGGENRCEFQRYLFKDCKLVMGISNFFKENIMLEPGVKHHLPVTGHVVVIAQTIAVTLENFPVEPCSFDSTEVDVGDGAFFHDARKGSFDGEQSTTHNLREILLHCNQLTDWNEFVESCLRPYLAPVQSTSPTITNFEYENTDGIYGGFNEEESDPFWKSGLMGAEESVHVDELFLDNHETLEENFIEQFDFLSSLGEKINLEEHEGTIDDSEKSE